MDKPKDVVAREDEEEEMVIGAAVGALVGGVRHQSVSVSQALKQFTHGGRSNNVFVHDAAQREQQSQDLRRGDMIQEREKGMSSKGRKRGTEATTQR